MDKCQYCGKIIKVSGIRNNYLEINCSCGMKEYINKKLNSMVNIPNTNLYLTMEEASVIFETPIKVRPGALIR